LTSASSGLILSSPLTGHGSRDRPVDAIPNYGEPMSIQVVRTADCWRVEIATDDGVLDLGEQRTVVRAR
jgi:hypothetical protein